MKFKKYQTSDPMTKVIRRPRRTLEEQLGGILKDELAILVTPSGPKTVITRIDHRKKDNSYPGRLHTTCIKPYWKKADNLTAWKSHQAAIIKEKRV